MSVIDLGTLEQAFARGGNRDCYRYPGQPDRCIKLLRADRSPAIRRAQKGFPKNLRPLASFDENLEEYRVLTGIARRHGAEALALVPRCFGFVTTRQGEGLCTELIRDDDGRIAITLKQYLWQQGVTPAIRQCIEQFLQQWVALGMPSRHLLLHNILVQQAAGEPRRLVVIDGLGWPDALPLADYWPWLARRKAARRARGLWQAIEALLQKQRDGGDWGYHGWLDDEQRSLDDNSK